MQTIQLEIEDSLYETIREQGLDIKEEIITFLNRLSDDGYPSITTNEAKKRVADAVERYRSGTGIYTPVDEKFQQEMADFIESI